MTKKQVEKEYQALERILARFDNYRDKAWADFMEDQERNLYQCDDISRVRYEVKKALDGLSLIRTDK